MIQAIRKEPVVKKITTSFLGILFAISLFSQNRADNWVFNGFGLNFQADSVTILTNFAPLEYRSMGIISDINGALLFYTDGMKVWNKNHDMMPNGDSLYANGILYAQESLIVPKPNSNSLYYAFSLNPSTDSTSGVYATTVDMSLENGLGDVIQKGERILDSSVTNKITAIYHENQSDIWLITHKNNSNQYYAFLVSEDGISETPVISEVGTSITSAHRGQLKASPDGTKLVCAYDEWTNFSGEGFDIFEFNSTTGELYNPLIFTTPTRGCHGTEFSSDGTKLYVYKTGSSGESTLFQFDIEEHDYDKINESRTTLLHPIDNGFSQMQLAPNGKIYISKSSGQISGMKYLAVINSPNENRFDCDVVELGLYLGEVYVQMFTPNFIQSYFFKTNFEVVNRCAYDSTSFQITNLYHLDSVLWNFGDNTTSTDLNPKHFYTIPQNYTITLICYYPDKVDTLAKNIVIKPTPVVDLGNDTTICHGYKLNLSDYYYSILWSDGTSNNSLLPDTTGVYWVEVKNTSGCATIDSISLVINPAPSFSLGNDSTICENSNYLLIPDNNYVNSTYLWSTNSTDSLIIVNTGGNYWLQITNNLGCNYVDNISFETIETPVINLGNDTIINQNSFVTLDAGFYGKPTTYLWENDSTSQFHNIVGKSLNTGSYTSYVNVTIPNGCIISDTVNILITEGNCSDVQVFPNPCRDYLTIKTKCITNKHIKIYTDLGQHLHSEELISNEHTINTSKYSRASYVIVVYDDNERVNTIKFVVK